MVAGSKAKLGVLLVVTILGTIKVLYAIKNRNLIVTLSVCNMVRHQYTQGQDGKFEARFFGQGIILFFMVWIIYVAKSGLSCNYNLHQSVRLPGSTRYPVRCIGVCKFQMCRYRLEKHLSQILK